MTDSKNKGVKPFLRWAGGKNWLVKEIDQYLPSSFGKYFEPFLGGGSMFFHLKDKHRLSSEAILSDSNEELINAYKVISDNPKELIEDLRGHKNDEGYYYNMRSKNFEDPIKAASRFIFLNRTSFNGIYRENLKGEYNVPYGHKSYKQLFDFENIKEVSKSFKRVKLKKGDFESVVKKAAKDDLIFFDPPYTVAHSNNGFIKYNQKIFSWEDQIRLSELIKKLNEKGVKFILTNACHYSVIDLYHGIGNLSKLKRYSVVGGKGAKREEYSEILITNVNG